jgi:RNA polymerase-associated protein RTF1
MEPFFEEIIVGCFVRIGIGVSNSGLPIYRLCQVKNVDAKDPDKNYKFQHRTTYKWLNCFWGDESKAARWQMVRASDQAPSRKIPIVNFCRSLS